MNDYKETHVWIFDRKNMLANQKPLEQIKYLVRIKDFGAAISVAIRSIIQYFKKK